MRLAKPLNWGLAVLALVSSAATLAAGKCDRLIATGSANNPPFIWRDAQNGKRLIGANVDLLEQLAAKLGVKVEVLHTGDAKKALEEVRSGRVDILLDTPLQAERLGELDFVHPAITQLETFAWVRNEPGFLYSSPADLADRRGIRTADGPVEEPVAEGLPLAKTMRQALKQLRKGEVDFVLHERYSTLARLDRAALEQVQRLTPAVAQRGMHLAISHDSACNDPWLRGQLALQMTELQAAGVPERLLVDNLALWKQQRLAREASTQK
jgi:ABC-type amino acid transport substrate-binding protein